MYVEIRPRGKRYPGCIIIPSQLRITWERSYRLAAHGQILTYQPKDVEEGDVEPKMTQPNPCPHLQVSLQINRRWDAESPWRISIPSAESPSYAV